MQDTLVHHPANGTFVFGYIHERNSRGVKIPGGPILLKRGRHDQRGGFGVRHIWSRHEHDVRRHGGVSEAGVPIFVAGIICPGAPVYCEFERIRDLRLRVLRGCVGVAVLEYKPEASDPHWSIVTAFGRRDVNGDQVGNVAVRAAATK